jgi:hypothetical protein
LPHLAGITPPYGGKNSAVTGERFFLPPFHLQRSFPRFAQQIDQYIYDFQNCEIV